MIARSRWKKTLRVKEASGTARLQEEEAGKVCEFKYFGAPVQSNRERGRELKKQVEASVEWVE